MKDKISAAAKLIRSGCVVAFPTETVYGLGADAFNPEAVSKIYSLKGRPADNPLILHLEGASSVGLISNEVSENAERLMEMFWPGPLTLILKKKPDIPAWVGGHPTRATGTVAVRVPANETARALIKESGRVVAAPSANKAGTPSPTRAEHVMTDFAEELRRGGLLTVLDGGETVCGLESAVVDMTGAVPRVLRPGAVTARMISEALGCAVETPSPDASSPDIPPPSPGMKYRHYAPAAPMTLVCGEPERAAMYIADRILGARGAAGTVGILATEQTVKLYAGRFRGDEGVFVVNAGDRSLPETIAHSLYDCLRRFDSLGVGEIYAEGIEETEIGQAVMNRMRKASEGRVVWAD